MLSKAALPQVLGALDKAARAALSHAHHDGNGTGGVCVGTQRHVCERVNMFVRCDLVCLSAR